MRWHAARLSRRCWSGNDGRHRGRGRGRFRGPWGERLRLRRCRRTGRRFAGGSHRFRRCWLNHGDIPFEWLLREYQLHPLQEDQCPEQEAAVESD